MLHHMGLAAADLLLPSLLSSLSPLLLPKCWETAGQQLPQPHGTSNLLRGCSGWSGQSKHQNTSSESHFCGNNDSLKYFWHKQEAQQPGELGPNSGSPAAAVTGCSELTWSPGKHRTGYGKSACPHRAALWSLGKRVQSC